MEPRHAWIATAAVMVTVILSEIGATWAIERNTATREEITQLRNEIKAEIRTSYEAAEAQMRELRGYIRPAPRATRARQGVTARLQRSRYAACEEARERCWGTRPGYAKRPGRASWDGRRGLLLAPGAVQVTSTLGAGSDARRAGSGRSGDQVPVEQTWKAAGQTKRAEA
jgi:hypothetical protein